MKKMSIRSYLLLLVAISTFCFLGFAFVLRFVGGHLLGLTYREVLIFLLLFYPFMIMGTVYGFYKGLVRHYGLQGKERLFPFEP